MEPLSEEIQKELANCFTQTSRDGQNALMLAVEKNPSVVPFLLEGMQALPKTIKDKVLTLRTSELTF